VWRFFALLSAEKHLMHAYTSSTYIGVWNIEKDAGKKFWKGCFWLKCRAHLHIDGTHLMSLQYRYCVRSHFK
jgi:hypothetical protein